MKKLKRLSKTAIMNFSKGQRLMDCEGKGQSMNVWQIWLLTQSLLITIATLRKLCLMIEMTIQATLILKI